MVFSKNTNNKWCFRTSAHIKIQKRMTQDDYQCKRLIISIGNQVGAMTVWTADVAFLDGVDEPIGSNPKLTMHCTTWFCLVWW